MKIILYDEPAVPEIRIASLADFVKQSLGCTVKVKENAFENMSSRGDDDNDDAPYRELASIRISNPSAPFYGIVPTQDEIGIEKQPKEQRNTCNNIVMYEGYELHRILQDNIIGSNQKNGNDRDKDFHIVFTTRLPCTYDENDYRYHGRAIICSNPCIISTTGLVEAPAKPRSYYFRLFSNMLAGVNTLAAKKAVAGQDYLDYRDSRMFEVLKGYILQGLFYYATGEPFCDSKSCRLYNAHWQQDMIHAQLHHGKLCDRHDALFYDTVKKRFE